MPVAAPVPDRLVALPADVRDFLAGHGLEAVFAQAAALAAECFPPGSGLAFRVEDDPDTDGTWAVIDVAAAGDVDDVVGCYAGFAERWARVAPAGAGDRVRVTFNLA